MSLNLYIFDIDGTLTTTKSGATFRATADDWQWLPGRLEKLLELRAQGVQIALATNQAGVAFPWSKYSEAQIQAQIDIVAATVSACYVGVCYSTPNPKALPEYHNPNDERRKPNPGLLIEAMHYCGVSAQETLFIGDMESDEQAAQTAGCHYATAEGFFS